MDTSGAANHPNQRSLRFGSDRHRFPTVDDRENQVGIGAHGRPSFAEFLQLAALTCYKKCPA